MLPSSAALKLPDVRHRTSERVQHVIPVSASWGWPLNLFVLNFNHTTWMMPHRKRTHQAPHTEHQKRKQCNKQNTRFQCKQHAIWSPWVAPLWPASWTQFSFLRWVALKGQCTIVFSFHHGGLLCKTRQCTGLKITAQTRTAVKHWGDLCVHKTDNRCRIIKARPSPWVWTEIWSGLPSVSSCCAVGFPLHGNLQSRSVKCYFWRILYLHSTSLVSSFTSV